MTKVDLHDDVLHYPVSVRTPRQTKRVARPPGDLRLPMKASWNEANLSVQGKRMYRSVAPGFGDLFGCPPDLEETDVGGDGSNAIVPPSDGSNAIAPEVPDLFAAKLAEDV